jgi:hypothetical protein
MVIPQSGRYRPLLREIPPSFPDWTRDVGHYDANGFSLEYVKRFEPHNRDGLLSSIIADDVWDSEGTVTLTEGGGETAATYDKIIIQLDREAAPEEVFTVFNNRGSIDDLVKGDSVGHEILIKAEIQILEAVESELENTYRAVVLKAALPLTVGDEIIRGHRIPRVKFDVAGSIKALRATLVNGEFGDRKVFGLYNSVFLDRGRDQGLQVGDLLRVSRNLNVRNADSPLEYDPKPVGIIKIVHADHNVSTAVVMRETDTLIAGDRTIGPDTGPLVRDGEDGLEEGSEENAEESTEASPVDESANSSSSGSSSDDESEFEDSQ